MYVCILRSCGSTPFVAPRCWDPQEEREKEGPGCGWERPHYAARSYLSEPLLFLVPPSIETASFGTALLYILFRPDIIDVPIIKREIAHDVGGTWSYYSVDAINRDKNYKYNKNNQLLILM